MQVPRVGWAGGGSGLEISKAGGVDARGEAGGDAGGVGGRASGCLRAEPEGLWGCHGGVAGPGGGWGEPCGLRSSLLLSSAGTSSA